MTLRTTKMIGMILISLIKFMNTSFRMAVESVELLDQMISIVRKNNNKKIRMNLLFVLLMMKLFDAIGGNSISLLVDLVKIAVKFINIVELTDILTIVFILIGYVYAILKSDAILNKMTGGVALKFNTIKISAGVSDSIVGSFNNCDANGSGRIFSTPVHLY